jgi:hypothetical protein
MQPNKWPVFTQDEAEEACPYGSDCSYAQIPACTLATIFQQCSIYRDKLIGVPERPPERPDNRKSHLAEQIDKFKGPNS